jgi:hypothetical protein
MAREHCGDSASEMEVAAFVSFVGEVFGRYKNPEVDVPNSR